MTDPASIPCCAACGGALAVDGPQAWCPRCALRATMEAGHDESRLFAVAGHVVLAELGRGATGVVYRARQEYPAREVALKMLRPHEAGSIESRARFRLEVAALAALDHPAILPVFSVGEHDGLPYFTMKLCQGSLAGRVGQYRGKWRETAGLAAGLAEAVHHAHVRGVLHRDLKPGNILFDDEGRPFVSDFGLAKLVEAPGENGPLTRPQWVMGTPGYLAPEVLAGGAGRATTLSDVYALGALLHELLAGKPAGVGVTLGTGVPRDLAVVCACALAAEPDRRYPSAEALAADLHAWLAGRPIVARPVTTFGRGWLWARRNPGPATLAAALLIALLAGATGLTLQNRRLRQALARTAAAETQTRLSLATALVAQARTVRQSGSAGQREESLALLRRAAGIQATSETRTEAIAALLLPDWQKEERRMLWPGGSITATPSPDFSCLLVEDTQSVFTLRKRSGESRWSWTAPSPSASHPVFSPDGRWVALRLRDDTVRVLAVEDGRMLLELAGRPYAFKGAIWFYGHDMDFSPDGKTLAITRPEGGVSFHALPGGEARGEWATSEWITTIHFSPDGARLAAGGSRKREDALLAVIEAPTGRLIAREKTAGRVEFITWSPDGRWLACRPVSGGTEVRAAGNLAVKTTLPDKDALHGKFLPDGARLMLTRQVDGTRLWDIAEGRMLLLKTDAGRPGNWWQEGAFRQWRSFSNGPVVLQELTDSPVLKTTSSDEDSYTVPEKGWPLDRSADGEFLAIGGWGGGTIMRAATGERVLRIALVEDSDAGMLRFDPAGDAVWVSLVQKGLWRVPLLKTPEGGLAAGPAEQIDAEEGFLLTASNRPSRRLALVRPQGGSVKIVDTQARRVMAKWAHGAAAMAEFSPDGSQLVVNGLAVGKEPGQPATIYAAETGQKMRVLGQAPGRVARWSPAGTWVLAGDGEKTTKVWRAADWSAGPALPGEDVQGSAAPMAFSADDRTLLAWTGNDFQLVDVAAGRRGLALPQPHGTGVLFDVGLDADRRMWTVDLRGRVQVWDLAALQRELAGLGLAVAPDK